jgi:hypothetical protein
MTFTRFYSTEEKRKAMYKSQALLNRKTQMKIGEVGYKIQSKRCLFFNKTNVKIKQEEEMTH